MSSKSSVDLVEVLNSLRAGVEAVWKESIGRKEKGTTGKVEPSPKFPEEVKFTCHCAISKFVSVNDIPLKLVFNLDQTPPSYASPRKYTFDLKGSKTVPIKGVDDNQQITATFTVTSSGSFYLSSLSIAVKLSVVYPSMIFLVALMLPSLQIIAPFMKNLSDCSRKSSFPTFKPRNKSLVTQTSSTHCSYAVRRSC